MQVGQFLGFWRFEEIPVIHPRPLLVLRHRLPRGTSRDPHPLRIEDHEKEVSAKTQGDEDQHHDGGNFSKVHAATIAQTRLPRNRLGTRRPQTFDSAWLFFATDKFIRQLKICARQPYRSEKGTERA